MDFNYIHPLIIYIFSYFFFGKKLLVFIYILKLLLPAGARSRLLLLIADFGKLSAFFNSISFNTLFN